MDVKDAFSVLQILLGVDEIPGEEITLKVDKDKLEIVLESRIAKLKDVQNDKLYRLYQETVTSRNFIYPCKLCFVNQQKSKILEKLKDHENSGSVADTQFKTGELGLKFSSSSTGGDEVNSSRSKSYDSAAFCCDCENVKWSFTVACLSMLEVLHYALSEQHTHDRNTDSRPTLLKVSEQKLLGTALQVAVGFGICLNLYPGVGFPLSKRANFSKLFSIGNSLSLEGNERHLFICITVLTQCISNTVLGPLILARHLGDILASLIQIVFRPDNSADKICECKCCITDEQLCFDATNVSSTETITDTNDKNKDAAESSSSVLLGQTVLLNVGHCPCYGYICKHERKWCQTELEKLLKRLYQPLVIRELLVLQGAPGKQNSQIVQVQKGKKQSNITPRWFRQVCGKLLSERLMEKNGVQFVLQAIFEESDIGSVSWQKCDMVGKVVASCPMQAGSVEEYYSQVTPQVIDILKLSSSSNGRHYIRVASSCISAMVQHYPKLAIMFLIKPLLKPLFTITEDTAEKTEIVKEKDLTMCIENIHKIFVCGIDPSPHMVKLLGKFVQPLFEIYCFTHSGISHLKSLVQDTLLWFLRNADNQLVFSAFFMFVFGYIPKDDSKPSHNDARDCDFNTISSCYNFENGSGGGVIIKMTSDDISTEVKENVAEEHCVTTELRIVTVLSLLKAIEKDSLVGELFISLFRNLTNILAENGDQNKTDKTTSYDLSAIDQTIDSLRYKITLISFIAALGEKFGSSILTETSQSVSFLKSCLDVCSAPPKSGFDLGDSSENFKNEILTMALGILSIIIGESIKVKEYQFDELKVLLPSLRGISEKHTDKQIKQLADDLLISISTHGAVEPSKAHHSGNKDESFHQANSSDLSSDAAYDQAMAELKDPLLPTRGHGLLQLARILAHRNKKALENSDTLLSIFQDNLAHDDTYIYLASIQGMVALSDRKHAKVVPFLAREFAMFCEMQKVNSGGKEDQFRVKRYSPELRMKLGEALIKAMRCCGSLLPRYSQVILASLLTGVKDNDNHVRASSLSNIADACKLLRFAVGPVIFEIFNCVSSVAQSDPAVEVRRSALLVITLLMEGLGKDTIEALSSVLKDLYRLLKQVSVRDPDDVTRSHAQHCLDQLDVIMKGYLFPKQRLEKKIQILQ